MRNFKYIYFCLFLLLFFCTNKPVAKVNIDNSYFIKVQNRAQVWFIYNQKFHQNFIMLKLVKKYAEFCAKYQQSKDISFETFCLIYGSFSQVFLDSVDFLI